MDAVRQRDDAGAVLTIRNDILINRDTQAVYDLIVRRERTPSWNRLIRSSKRIDGEDGHAGARYQELGLIGPIKVRYTTTVLEAVGPSKFVAYSDSPNVTLHWGFDLRPEGAGTRLCLWSNVLALRGPALLMRPLMAVMMPRGSAANLERIRTLVETREGIRSQ